jgi:teichoic acid transport system permease protein
MAEQPVTVYEPHVRGLPPLRAYATQLWRRRGFAIELARTDLRAKHLNTVFGQLWTVINPTLLAGVYFLLLGVIAGGPRGTRSYLALITAGIFLFYFTRNSLNNGAKSVVGGGKLIMNTAFPRVLLPFSAVVSAFLTLLPMLAVYAAIHLALGQPARATLLALPLLIAIHTVFNLGAAMGISAMQVYFRDTQSFLPYVVRIWMYLTPVLWALEHVPTRLQAVLRLNPLYPLFAAYQSALFGTWPSWPLIGAATAWSVVVFVVGAVFFLSREREFAVRL